jgi:hypothetical protein
VGKQEFEERPAELFRPIPKLERKAVRAAGSAELVVERPVQGPVRDGHNLEVTRGGAAVY